MNTAGTVNIAAALVEMAANQPEALAIACPRYRGDRPETYHRWSYRELNERSDVIARGFVHYGISRGTRTALMVRPSLELFALTFALFKVGAIPVLIDPGIGVRNLGVCLAESEPEAFLGIPRAQLARVILGWGRATIRKVVTVGPRFFWGGTTLSRIVESPSSLDKWTMEPTEAEEVAAILFTSGSTGIPKGVVMRHRHFRAQVEAIRDLYDIQPGEVDFPTFPLFGLFDPALGMTTVIPDMDPTRPARVDPRRILPAMEAFEVTNMFGSPALLDTVGRYGEIHGVSIPSLRRVISAGAPVSLSVLERFRSMLSEEARIVTPYGATESLPICSIGSDELLEGDEIRSRTESGEGVCVGHPVDGVTLEVVAIRDDPIAREEEIEPLGIGEVGEVLVRSEMTSDTYFNRPRSTELAKVATASGRPAHRMGDLGFIDEQGRLWFCGRKSQRVMTEGGVLFTVPCELVFQNHPSVYRSALVGVVRGEQQIPVICVELEPGSRVTRSVLEKELRELALSRPHTRAIETFLVHPAFPVDIRHNAKIRRGELSRWAQARLVGRKKRVTVA